MSVINWPILYINDPLKGRPLFNGQIFVGIPDLDPEDGNGNPINSKQLNVVEEDGTIVPVSQPFVISAGGNPVYNGKPVRLDVDGNYSIKILNKLGAQTYYIENVFEGEPLTDIDLINDLSQAYEFATWQLMVDSLIVFPDGKPLKTTEHTAGTGYGGASYLKTAGTTTKPVGSPDLLGGGYAALQSNNGYFYPKQFGAIVGAESFTAIEACINEAGEGAVFFWGNAGDEFFTTDGELPILSNTRHIFNGVEISRPTLNNVNAIFRQETAIDNVVFKGGFLKGNTDTTVGAFGGTAACVRIKGGTNILFYEMDMQDGASGLQLVDCDDVRVYDSEIISNTLTGISGNCNRLKVKRSKVKNNGFDTVGGFLHEIYMINSSFCELVGNEIGDNVDFSISVNIKNKSSDSKVGYELCLGWIIKGNTFFNDGGVNFTNASSEGELPIDQIPHALHVISGNHFTDSAGLSLTNPQDVTVVNNTGDETSPFLVRSSSERVGYEVSLQAVNNTFGSVSVAATNNTDTAAFTSDVIFTDMTLLTSGDAINWISTFGGNAYGTFRNISIPNTASLFDATSQSSYQSAKIVMRGGGDVPHLATRDILTTVSAAEVTPVVGEKGWDIEIFGLFNNMDIANTAAAPDGAMLTFGMQQNAGSSNRTPTFGSEYRLTDAWKVNKNINVQGQYFYITFIRRAGLWEQFQETGWVS